MLLWSILPFGKTTSFYSITAMRKKHPAWFRMDLDALFEQLRRGEISPVILERLRFDDVADAHRRLEEGGLAGKMVLDPWA